ncbi:Neural proliferation differentiation and control protein 1 [Eumeta japonica]|uniref:Neural proliferation differentiation and control protein 1 n=1 Tax=Eumeta variegata TaxID=151549 RepID=A0A4C2A6U6_EUMVA|nr:Neural proliferation differentiation and control protein 1 [Eumeta japonica]
MKKKKGVITIRFEFRPSDTESQTDTARQVFVAETITPDPTSSLYGVALIAAVGIALTITLLGFALSWYMMSKKAKAAANVDYPAYGVTGPTLDCPGDRKLAHSAHMYHYQHQKQQILAMER